MARECVYIGCPRRLNKQNGTGYCVQHRHKAERVKAQWRSSRAKRRPAGPPRGASAADRMRDMAAGAWAAAAERGHRMSLLMRDYAGEPRGDGKPDSPGYIAYCLECDRFMVVDLAEEPVPYGDIVDSDCKPRPRLAERLDPYVLERSTSHAGIERRQSISDFGKMYLNDGPCTREALDKAGW